MSVSNRPVMIVAAGVIAILTWSGWLDTAAGLNEKGNKAFENKRYETALEAYRKAQVRKPSQAEIRYNLGTTLYQMDQFQEGQTQLKNAINQSAGSIRLQAQAWYNYGNAQYRLGQFDKAIEAYRKALELNPKDRDAKYNLELLQKKKKLFEDKQNKRDKEDKKDQQQNRQNKNRENQSQNQQKQNQQGGSGAKDQQNQDQNKEEGQQGAGQNNEQNQHEKPEQDQNQEMNPDPDKQGEEDQSQPKDPGSGQPQTPSGDGPDHQKNAKPEPKDQGRPMPLYQGQMSKENAIRILDALQQGEQELQILKRPAQPHKEREPEKDW